MLEIILLASANPHKIEELRQILEPFGIELKSTHDFPCGVEVVEDQPDLEGNALKKARYWNQLTGLPALADDTGLEVDALKGAPGVYSARYAGEHVTYAQNVEKLLRELDEENNRKARFRTVIAFVDGEMNNCLKEVVRERLSMYQKVRKGLDMTLFLYQVDIRKRLPSCAPKKKTASATVGGHLIIFWSY